MKSYLRFLALLAALCVGWAANAQSLLSYTYSTGTSISKWRTLSNTTDLLGYGNVLCSSDVMDIGFVFPFGENEYTQYSVSSDGNLRLGSTATGISNSNYPFSSDNASADSPKINFLGCEGYHRDSVHYVRAQNFDISLSEGRKLLVVEFCLGTWSSATRNEQYKWQVHLYGNGNIEVVFPSTEPSTGPADSHQKGLCTSASDGWVINSSNTASWFSSGSSINWASGSWPEANRYYRFQRRYDYSVGPTLSWQTHTGSNSNDCDRAKWYRVFMNSGNQYTFKTGCGDEATANFDTKLCLYNYNGTMLADNDDGCENSRSKLSFVPSQNTYYFLKVMGYDETEIGDYTLAYRQECVDIPQYHYAIYPSTSWETHGSNLTTTDGCSVNRRIYKVSVVNGNTYIFKTGCGNEATADFDTFLELRDGNGNFVTSDDDGCGENLSKIEYTATQSRTLYLVVSGYTSSDIGNYTLAYKSCTGIPNYDTSLSPSVNWNTHSATTTGRCDGKYIYRVSVSEGNTYTFKTGCGDGATADFNTKLYLYDADGTQLTYDDDGCGYPYSMIEYTATASGYLYLVVRGYTASLTGSYTLAYRSCANIPNYDYSISLSTYWQTHSATTTGRCEGKYIYRMYLNADKPYVFKTGCDDGATADFDTYLELFDENGNWLKSDDDGCGWPFSKIEYTPASTGYYYLKVGGINESTTGSYTLAYRKVCTCIPDYDYDLTATTAWKTHSSTTTGNCNDENIYRISVTEGQQYVFKTGCGDGATADFDSKLYLYDANGNHLMANDDGCEENRSKIEYTMTASGYVYLIVRGYMSSYTGSYTLAYRNLVPRTITVTANPSSGGTVTGGGTYYQSDTCTVVATPAPGYVFVNWTKGSTVVSTNASYTFKVSANRTLKANFEAIPCGIAMSDLPYTENFDSYTTSTTSATGVEPPCWELVHRDVSMTNANRPQLCYNSNFAHSGNYSLKLYNRGVYAMPELEEGLSVNQIKLEMYLRQANANYQLQVGVWEEGGTFVPVATFNNSTTEVEYVTCDFSDYRGQGGRIAFRNTLGSGTTAASSNYLDDITLSIMCERITLPYTENFDSYTNSTTSATGVEPRCWEMVQPDVSMTNANRPQLCYNSTFAHSGNYSLKLYNRGVYAMPELELEEGLSIKQVKLEMYLRQANANYQLQVGVWEDGGTFVPVATFNNSSTEVEYVTCDFSGYEGLGGRIAFRNTLGSGSTNFSSNYLDDITLSILCEGIPLPYTESFDGYTSSTASATGVEPRCWELVQPDVPMTNANRPQLCYNSTFAHSGNYSLKLYYRGVYAMPELELEEGTSIRQVKLEMYLRQANANYQLQVGVWEDGGTFVPVATFNNSSTGVEYVTCDFSGYRGSGGRIAFRNTLGSGSSSASSNYLDDITLTVTCGSIPLPYTENFEDYTSSTASSTRVEPACWELVQRDVTMTNANRPQLCYNSDFAHSGDYSLKLYYRGVYAMPELELEAGVSIKQVKLEMYLRQASANYRLQVGVWEDGGTFVPVATFNNSSTEVEYVTCDFSGYEGSGGRIAFRNTLGSGSSSASSNYLDDITLTVRKENCSISLPYSENFDSYTISPVTETGVEPDCWEVVTEDVALTNATKPQLYLGFSTSGDYSLRLKNRCVYAMPALASGVNVKELTMTFQLRQANALYRLQVGVVDNRGNFTVVKTINNATADMEEVTVSFADYTGKGRRIAFRNTLKSGSTLAYSTNYIDDINITRTATTKSAEVTDANAGMLGAERDKLDIVVYPNPTTDVVNVQCSMDNVQCSGIEVVDIYGKIITTVGTRFIASDQTPTQINVSGLSAGMYFVRVTTDRGVVTKPFVKR